MSFEITYEDANDAKSPTAKKEGGGKHLAREQQKAITQPALTGKMVCQDWSKYHWSSKAPDHKVSNFSLGTI